jgi:hypothetical protein
MSFRSQGASLSASDRDGAMTLIDLGVDDLGVDDVQELTELLENNLCFGELNEERLLWPGCFSPNLRWPKNSSGQQLG